MRLGEIRVLIEKVLNDQNQIFIEQEAIYGGQAYKIKRANILRNALEILIDQTWNTSDSTQIESILSKWNKEASVISLDANEFNQLNGYISTLNRQMPLFFGILEATTEEQDEQVINIKIPEASVVSLKDLANFNNRIDKLLKLFAVDGQFEFQGLDKGSSWYEVIAIGMFTYQGFIACLKVAREYLQTKQEYYKTKRAELDYKASLKKDSDYSEECFKEYVDKRLGLELEDKVKEALINAKIKENGKTAVELQSQLIKATKELVEVLGTGAEFHLSLNPPVYAEELAGSIRIDYVKLNAIQAARNKAPTIEAPKTGS